MLDRTYVVCLLSDAGPEGRESSIFRLHNLSTGKPRLSEILATLRSISLRIQLGNL